MALHAITKKFHFKNEKSDPTMMILKCCGIGCPWRVYAVMLKDSDVFQIRTYEGKHTCTIDVRGGYQQQATASVVGELMRTKFAGVGAGPKPGEIRHMMRADHGVNISYWKAWRSREMAIANVHGSCNASYVDLPSYLNKLVTVNPGTIANLCTEPTDDGGQRFKYMFVSLGASVKGYRYMRKVVVVDGTHLKGKYAGCLLTASVQDGSYQIFPLAIAVVDSENDASWEWFFQQLKALVPDEEGLVFVSDMNSSIYKGISKVYEGVAHCIYIVHLKRNIRTNFKVSHLTYLVAKAARSYRVEDFNKTFNGIRTWMRDAQNTYWIQGLSSGHDLIFLGIDLT
ncbi:uncharacterized protein LOC108832956 [Raphanus sativus]|uniref:Uncharacterized protein LOC108832956 n=1 Tax=Raphanus sativus TaxID=3726 RepID=A0A6J0LRG2_RAPSA|nr:uncharacterized protein LOC108832956 [Raphanus sativus]